MAYDARKKSMQNAQRKPEIAATVMQNPVFSV